MTPQELETYIKQQATISARIVQKTVRARQIATSYGTGSNKQAKKLASRILNSLSRPGVAPTTRPKSAAGGETFHFKVTTVNRVSDFVTKFKGAKAGSGAAHGAYIEREGAAERIGPQFARTSDDMHREVWEALGGQAYIERPGAAEPVGGRGLASFGNIADTFDERLAFWDAMEEAATTPKSSAIRTQRGNDPAFWAQVDADPSAPKILKEAPPFVAYPVDETAPGAEPGANMPVIMPERRYNDVEASAVLDYVRQHRTKAPKPPTSAERGVLSKIGEKAAALVGLGPSQASAKGPAPVAVEIEPGRGGRIQTRIIVELPHELDAEQRLKLAEDYCRKKFVDGRAAPLPYWCVIHAPDHHNDPRNTHMHIAFAERPAQRMIHPETGVECWDFEVLVKIKDKNKHNRLTRAFEQKTDRTINAARWVTEARKDFATMANAALKLAGKPKVYDARTYEKMGIGEKPRERINAKDYLKEKKGETTAAGTASIAAQWEREEQRLSDRFNTFGTSKETLALFDGQIARWKHGRSSVWAHLLVHKHEYAVSVAFIKSLKAEKAANSFVLAKIQSKILPPIENSDETTLLAQDFIRMFRLDIVDRHNESIKIQNRNAKRSLAALKAAFHADPKTTDDTGFLTGRPRLDQMILPMPYPNRRRGPDETSETIFSEWRDALVQEQADARAIRAAVSEQIAARNGELIISTPQAREPSGAAPPPGKSPGSTHEQDTASKTVAPATTAVRPDVGPSATPPLPPSPEAKARTDTSGPARSPSSGDASRTSADTRAPASAAPPEAPTVSTTSITPVPPSRPAVTDAPEAAPQVSPKAVEAAVGGIDLKAYAAALKTMTEFSAKAKAKAKIEADRKAEAEAKSAAQTPSIPPARPGVPAGPKRYGDEKEIAFFSETGAPIQYRALSEIRIKTADEQAEAVIAAIKKRREEERKKDDAEVAAMRADLSKIRPSRRQREAGPDHDLLPRPDFLGQTDIVGAAADLSRRLSAVTSGMNEPEIRPTVLETTKPNTNPNEAIAPVIPVRPRIGSSKPTRTLPPQPNRTSTINQRSTPPTTPATTPATNTPPTREIEATTPPAKPKSRTLSAEELRKRALMAAKNRGRGR